jgi:hypothetical protein
MPKNRILCTSDLEAKKVNLHDEENVIGPKKKRESTAHLKANQASSGESTNLESVVLFFESNQGSV